MVYQGPSRGCISCKVRRKKCDETRPSCSRCTRAKRTCGGYEEAPGSTFRLYGSHTPSSSHLSLDWSPRKCSLPKRTVYPGTNILPEDVLPAEKTHLESSMLAVRCFFYDFCSASTNSDLSRGYLSSLQDLCLRLGPGSDLVKACSAVGYACHCKPMNRPRLVEKADGSYFELLGALAKAVEGRETAKARETRLVSMLLGLYQISKDGERNYGYHIAHAKGLAALMNISNSPRHIMSKLLTKSCMSPDSQSDGLDNLLYELNRAWDTFQNFSSGSPDNLQELRDSLLHLDARFAKWESSRQPEFRPTTLSKLGASRLEPSAAGFWPGNVDTYFDLYVAGVWNIFRAAHLLLFYTIFQVIDGTVCINQLQTATRLAEDILASVPYHLTDNLQVFLSEAATSTDIRDPGRYLGGFLIMHPLYVISKMPFLSDVMRDYAKRCLEWVNAHMGIGQAAVLAQAQNLDRGYLGSGWMIIWSGFLM